MTDDSLIIDLVCEWDDKRAKGEAVTLEDLCRDNPHLLEPVRVAITKLRVADGMLARTLVARASAEDSTLPQVPGYEVLEVLGRGGMGVVYMARQISVNRLVALKMIRSGNLSGTVEKARFQVEAEAVAALKHPNVVQLYEYGAYQGQPYFTLEYVEGGSLGAKIRKTTLPPPEAAALVAILARAMAAAHARGIVHRDLKPENVLLSADGNPKITDFGLAKTLNRETEAGTGSRSGEPVASAPTVCPPTASAESTGTQTFTQAPSSSITSASTPDLTRPGAILGTPSYMAPEQARGEKFVGPAADIWALGAILYYVLTGRPPFLGADGIETIKQVIHNQPVTLRAIKPPIKPRLSRDLETICLKCLRKTPEKRYDSAQALADDLQRYLEGRPIRARPVGRVEKTLKWVKRNPLETVFVMVIMGLVFGSSALVYAKYLDEKAQARIAKKNEDEAKKQEGIAKDRANDLDREVRRTKRQRDNAAILAAQGDFANNNVLLARDRLDKIDSENQGWEWHYLKRHFEGGLFTLYGHTGAVSSVAVSADGGRIVTGSDDGTARVWDGRTGQSLFELAAHRGEVTSVAVSADGGRIVTGSRDRTARVWDGRTRQCLQILKEHTSAVMSVAVSADGGRIVTGSYDQTARVWDGDGKFLLELKGQHTDAVMSVALSADGGRIVTGSRDDTAKVWDGHNGQFLHSLVGHTDWVESVAVSADGGRIVTGSFDNSARVWDGDGKFLLELKGHTERVYSVTVSADGGRIVTGSLDKTARVWDGRTGERLLELKGHIDAVTSVALSADGDRVVTGSRDKTARVWDGRAGEGLLELKEHTGQVENVAVSRDGSRIITGSRDNTARVWDGRTGQCLLELKGHIDLVSSVAVSADGGRIVTGSWDRTARVWDGRTGRCLHLLEGHKHAVSSVALSADGNRIVTGSWDKTAWVWDGNGKLLHKLEGGHTDNVTSVAVSADGGRIVTGSWDRTARVWDGNGQCLLKLDEHPDTVSSVAVSADGGRIVTGSFDNAARVWDGDGKFLLELNGHTRGMSSVAVSPDGSRIATGSFDNTARLWDGRTGQSLLELKGHADLVNSVAMSADGGRIVTGSDDWTARVWDGHIGQGLRALKGHTDLVNSVAVSADGSRVVTRDLGNNTIVWDVATGKRLEDEPIAPPPSESTSRTPDGKYFFVSVGNRVLRVSLKIDDDECLRRFRLTRPELDWHILRKIELEAEENDYGAALHRWFEYRARGVAALDVGKFSEGMLYLAVAKALMPKVPVTPKFKPMLPMVP